MSNETRVLSQQALRRLANPHAVWPADDLTEHVRRLLVDDIKRHPPTVEFYPVRDQPDRWMVGYAGAARVFHKELTGLPVAHLALAAGGQPIDMVDLWGRGLRVRHHEYADEFARRAAWEDALRGIRDSLKRAAEWARDIVGCPELSDAILAIEVQRRAVVWRRRHGAAVIQTSVPLPSA